MSRAPSDHKVTQDRLFLLGFGLFFIGVIGAAFWIYHHQQSRITQLLSDDTLALVEIKLNRTNEAFLTEQLQFADTTTFNIPGVSRELNWSDFSPWIGSDIALSYLPEQQFLHAFDYRNAADAQAFISQFLLPGESLSEIQSAWGPIYTPAYSSSNAFVFHKGWLMWADSPMTLTTELGKTAKLAQSVAFQNIAKDLPGLKFIRAYLNFAGDTEGLVATNENQATIPLMRGLGASTPQWGLAVAINDNTLEGDVKVATHQAVYDDNQTPIASAANQTIPDLAYLAPKEALLFQNGEDLYAKYQHTKRYLNELDPQLALVFEGLIRAQSEQWFGADFDFESEFLSLIRGPYAFILDFNQGLEIGFISTLGPDQSPEDIKALIQKAQSRFTPTTEEVELPDGTIRSELVAADPQNIPITEQSLESIPYYSSNNQDGSVNFSYTQIGDYLVMANQVNLIENIISAHTNQNNALASNQDFRSSVLYEFNPAEVYGFVNADKLDQFLFYWQESQAQASPLALNRLQGLRNITFTRQVFPEVMYIKLRAFFNEPL